MSVPVGLGTAPITEVQMLRSTRNVRWLVALAALALVVAACNDEEEDNGLAVVDTGVEDTESAPSPEEGDATAEETEEAAEEEDVVVTPQEALALLDGEVSPFMVVYDWTDPAAPGSSQLTIAHDPPNKSYRVTSDEGTFFAIYGATNVMCVEAPGEPWQCLPGNVAEMAGQDPFQNVFDAEDLAALGLDPDEIEVASDTILDRPVACIHAAQVPGGVSNVEFCLDIETGVLLRNNGVRDEGPYTVEAVSISQPDASMFEPPAEVMDIPTG